MKNGIIGLLAGVGIAFASLGHAASGDDDVGACGLGSAIWAGKSGIAPKVFALTTNGMASETIAITAGTSGCSQDGVVKANWKLSSFVEDNKAKLARDISRGSGETLDAVAQLIGVTGQDKVAFVQTTRENMARIFPRDETSTKDILAGLRDVLASNDKLAGYAARI